MSYAFPAELADQVIARWQTFVARHDHPAPPLPAVDQLQYVLETAFFASFAREEGRHLQFVLCCAPGNGVTREGTTDGVPIVPFQTPRRLTIDALRSLAPAVSPANAAILVRCPPAGGAEACEITGVLHVGSNLARARTGRSIYHRSVPHALLVDVRDSGELHVYRGGIKLATLDAGSLQDQLAFSEIEFLPISDLLTRGGAALHERVVRAVREPEREASDFEWTALLNTVLSMVSGIQSHGHGGTLLLVAPGAAGGLPVRTKFDVDERQSMLTDRFVTFVNARHAFVERRLAAGPKADLMTNIEVTRLEDAMIAAEDALSDAADLVARLSAVDGALVVTSDLHVLGFGAEIVLDAARAVSAYEVTGHAQRPGTWPEVDSESFGMRHRSALRCVAVAPHTAAFVVSQDSAVSFFWKQDGRVLLKRGVTIANPNMAGL